MTLDLLSARDALVHGLNLPCDVRIAGDGARASAGLRLYGAVMRLLYSAAVRSP